MSLLLALLGEEIFMALVFPNRVWVLTSTTGTGTITLGAAKAGYLTFAEAGVANADTAHYVIVDGADFESGLGTYTSAGTTFSRDTVAVSKIAGVAGTSKISLSGTAQVFLTQLSSQIGGIGEANDWTGINTFTNSGLHLLDTNASHDLIIKPGSDLTADRILTITTGDAARTLTLNADVTLDFGNYTPTLFNTTNIASSTAYLCGWFRVGDKVTVFGKVDIDPTTTATFSVLGVSIPVASNFAADENAGGTCHYFGGTTMTLGILADAANDRVLFQGVVGTASNTNCSFSFTYRII